MITTSDIAARCGVTNQAILARAKSRGVTPKRVGGRCLWTRADVRRLVAAGKPGPRKEDK